MTVSVCSAAAKQQVLTSFCGKFSCTDGSSPSADLVMDSAGNLYGTTVSGGANGSGTIFLLHRDPSSGKWQRKVLHSFCGQGYPCIDGTSPAGKLVLDVNGNLYGTAMGGGGSNDAGTIFRLSYAGNRWQLKTLYRFCAKSECLDGKTPTSGLIYQGAASGALYDGTSPLYGTAMSGGANGAGIAFQLGTSSGKWTQSVIYDFCAQQNCADGQQPWQGLVMDTAGNLFGVTNGRGSQYGVVFELHQQGTWQESVLHVFCQAQNCTDGRAPNGLVMDAGGSLFGTAFGGGANNAGLVFKLIPKGENSPYAILYNFCAEQYCYDGAAPSSTLILDSTGSLYGTTYHGGMGYLDRDFQGGGTVFRLSRNRTYRVLRNFCSLSACTDGEYPTAGVMLDSAGNLFGTTQLGGSHGSQYQGGIAFAILH